jgi:hypothetical protein
LKKSWRIQIDTNQQLKKWLHRWRSVIDHSMKQVTTA